jgi:hypothetical protein
VATSIAVVELIFLIHTLETASVEKVSSRMRHSELYFITDSISDSLYVPTIKDTDVIVGREINLDYG